MQKNINAPIWTEDQRRAIELRENNILVAAAAGSGKTAVLVERVKQLILSGEASLDSILVVTFTKAAASEMKEKIVEAIRKEIKQNPNDSDLLRKQLNLIYKANISTFHSFALEVIRRYFHIIGIDPGFSMCDEVEAKILKARAMDALFEEKLAEGSREFIDFLDAYASTKTFDNLKKELIVCYEDIKTVPEPFERLKEAIEVLKYDANSLEQSNAFALMRGDIKRRIDNALYACEKTRTLLLEKGLPRIADLIYKDFLAIHDLEMANETESFDEFSKKVRACKWERLSAQKEEKPVLELIKPQIEKLRDNYKKDCVDKIKKSYCYQTLEEFLIELNESYEHAKTLEALLHRFEEIYREEKAEKNVIDFADIEHFALEILSNEAVADEYRKKFKHIFIDEYQDSNIIQETLIQRIARKNNVFMVGDVKQSIYKFRLAEPEIFENKYEDYKLGLEYSEAIDLNKNFRSKGNIISTVNAQFTPIMRGYDEAAALHQGVSYEGELDHPCELHIVDTDLEDIDESGYMEKGEEIDGSNEFVHYGDSGADNGDLISDTSSEEIIDLKAAEMEALATVNIIKESVRNTRIFDVKKGIERKLEYGDIVILMRSVKSAGSVYKKVFAAEGIPLHAEENEGYFNTIEIEVFMNLLRVIDNKRQDIPLISVLYSPIFGFSANDLLDIRLATKGKRISFCEAFLSLARGEEDARMRAGEILAKKCELALAKINKWKELAGLMPFADFIWKLMQETGFYIYAGALPLGLQRQANLRTLVDKAGDFSKNDSGIYGFLTYVERLKEKKIDIGQMSLCGESENVVRIMTIHKSKGLDFPMVIVAGMGRRFVHKQKTNNIMFHKDIGLGIKIVNKKENWSKKSLLQKIIERQVAYEMAEEEIRVLYVAYTRAIDKLVLLGTIKDWDIAKEKYELLAGGQIISATKFLDFAIPILGPTLGIKVRRGADMALSQAEKNEGKQRLLRLIEEAKHLPEDRLIADRLSYRYPYDEGGEIKSKYTVTELNRTEAKKKISLNVPDMISSDEKSLRVYLSAAEKGTIYHMMLEHIDFKNIDGISGEDLLANLVKDEFITSEEAKQVDPRKVMEFLDTPLAKRMVAAAKQGRLHKEAPFTLKIQQGGKDMLVQGIIDSYFEEDPAGMDTAMGEASQKEYVIVDYKSNFIKRGDKEAIEKIKEMYRGQIDIYTEALEKLKHGKVKERYIYLLSIGEAIKI